MVSDYPMLILANRLVRSRATGAAETNSLCTWNSA